MHAYIRACIQTYLYTHMHSYMKMKLICKHCLLLIGDDHVM